jgi:hypothetical protein
VCSDFISRSLTTPISCICNFTFQLCVFSFTQSSTQELFFRRNQKDAETLQDYSLNLMEIFDQIIKRDNTVLGDKDKVLKDRFIEGIKE